MELSQTAFTADGFLVHQRETGKIPFGVCTSDKNGCGWIAAYNLLRIDLHPAQWDRVRRDLSHFLPFQGKIGANAFVLAAYLRKWGCKLRVSSVLPLAKRQVEHCRGGILLYETGHSRHYVAFQRLSGGRLRFLNVNTPSGEVTLTLEEFYQRFVHFPLFFLITVRP
jgi:hypothetical protein